MDPKTIRKITEAKKCVLNNGGSINNPNKTIKFKDAYPGPGLKVWGAIDCLINYGGYVLVKGD